MASRNRTFRWEKLSDSELLKMRLCDLNLKLETSRLKGWIQSLYDELEEKKLRFRPYFWLSEEFFTPAGTAGVAIPFYLAHPRLEELERKQMFEAEGSTKVEFLKILRHETGHAIEHAYNLHRKKERIKVFGRSSVAYPDAYEPRPFSRRYVVNLDNWYAQAHPDEDFAETFAVWLRPSSRWRRKYKGWPALRKLECMDTLIKEVRDKIPKNRSRAKYEPIGQIKKSLQDYFDEKKARFGLDQQDDFYDKDLLKLFSSHDDYSQNLKAARFVRKIRKNVRRSVAVWTGQYAYNVDAVIEEMIERCEELDLRLTMDERRSEFEFLAILTVHTMNHIHSGGYQLAL